MNKHLLAGTMLTIAAVAQPAFAQDTAVAATPPAAAPAAPVLSPAITGPLAGNSAPLNFDLGGFGKVYVTGVASGIARFQDHAVTGAGDHGAYGDLSNGQVFIQKIDGVFQFYLQAGVYSLPSLGTPYTRATRVTDSTFGPLPQAFIKIAPTANFSIQAGKMPTLIGAEYTFTFENMNIDRGLLWNLEPAVSKGVQANYTAGPLAFSVSLNDGFYSSKYSTVSGSVAYTIDPKNVLAFAASGNTKTTTKSTVSTPGILNNSSIYNLILTHTDGPWLIQPYVQYTHVDGLVPQFGTTSASTIGGAILAKYSFTPEFSLPVRGEYVSSSGTRGGTAASFLYGTGSDAYSITVSPTYQYKIFFVRAEGSYVKAIHATAGSAFGKLGNDTSQVRGVLELGVLF
nr:outer membrane beta-barrel protein [Polymorphobacter sp.]